MRFHLLALPLAALALSACIPNAIPSLPTGIPGLPGSSPSTPPVSGAPTGTATIALSKDGSALAVSSEVRATPVGPVRTYAVGKPPTALAAGEATVVLTFTPNPVGSDWTYTFQVIESGASTHVISSLAKMMFPKLETGTGTVQATDTTLGLTFNGKLLTIANKLSEGSYSLSVSGLAR